MPRRGNSEGTIRQRGNGRWEARVTLGYGPDGRQQRRSFYGDARLEAQQKLTKAMRDLQKGLPPANERQTVGQFLTRWLEGCHKPNVRPTTYVRSAKSVSNIQGVLRTALNQAALGAVAEERSVTSHRSPRSAEGDRAIHARRGRNLPHSHPG